MLYHVYKLQMSDAARDAMNSAGSWDAHAESKAYADLRRSIREKEMMPYSVMSAALMGMYHHGLTVEAQNLEEVFAYDNVGPTEGVEATYHCRGLASLSVGDVVMSENGVFICAPMGWVKMVKEAELGFVVMAKQIARQRPNALDDAA